MRRVLIAAAVLAAGYVMAQEPWMVPRQRRVIATSAAYEWTTNDYVMTWAIPSTDAVTVPGRSGYTPDAQIYWQSTDAPLSVTAYNDDNLTHSYDAAGTYQIIITGDWPALYFNNAGNKALIRSVESWGTGANWASLERAFFGCAGMTNGGPACPAMPSVTSLFYAWRGCTGLTVAPDVSALTNVTELRAAWYGCSGLTAAPDVSALTNVTSLFYAWSGCTGLTAAPDVSALTKVTTLRAAWYGCYGLTAAPDVSALTNVTTLRYTWCGCTGLTNVPQLMATSTALTTTTGAFQGNAKMGGSVVELWNTNLFPNVTAYANTFTGCTNLSNYADIPNGWKGL
jgi:hypothetical protein